MLQGKSAEAIPYFEGMVKGKSEPVDARYKLGPALSPAGATQPPEPVQWRISFQSPSPRGPDFDLPCANLSARH